MKRALQSIALTAAILTASIPVGELVNPSASRANAYHVTNKWELRERTAYLKLTGAAIGACRKQIESGC